MSIIILIELTLKLILKTKYSLFRNFTLSIKSFLSVFILLLTAENTRMEKGINKKSYLNIIICMHLMFIGKRKK